VIEILLEKPGNYRLQDGAFNYCRGDLVALLEATSSGHQQALTFVRHAG
jgi:hypothetical protein